MDRWIMKPELGSQKKRLYYGCVILLFIASIYLKAEETMYRQQFEIRELNNLMNIAKQTMATNRPFQTPDERESALDSLYLYRSQITDIAKEDSCIAAFTNGKLTLDERIMRLKDIVEQQIKKIRRTNAVSSSYDSYKKAIETKYLLVIDPTVIDLPTIDIGFRFTAKGFCPSASFIQVNSQDSIIYRQCFLYNSSINSFILPNRPKEGIEITMGVITIEKKDTILYYSKYNTYVQLKQSARDS